uniref:Saposin B-type domain-containing protein n=1 Tax=Bursaphelenchus xylophilus TaxID=6326 RepID=A0A1I7RYU7_BURXY
MKTLSLVVFCISFLSTVTCYDRSEKEMCMMAVASKQEQVKSLIYDETKRRDILGRLVHRYENMCIDVKCDTCEINFLDCLKQQVDTNQFVFTPQNCCRLCNAAPPPKANQEEQRKVHDPSVGVLPQVVSSAW